MGGEAGGCGEGGSEGGGWKDEEGEGDLIVRCLSFYLVFVYGVLDTRFVVFTKVQVHFWRINK